MKTTRITRLRYLSWLCVAVCAWPARQEAQAQNKAPQVVSDYVDTGLRPFVCGATDSHNSLVITNGGSVNSYTAFIGQKGGSDNNAALVTGSKAAWYSTCGFDIGDYSSGNSLTIVDGGKVSCNAGYLGWSGGANRNAATVSGAGSIFNVSETLFVGNGGSGNALVINDGGTVYSSAGATIGGGGGADNAATVSGRGSVWDVGSGNVSIGAGSATTGNRLTLKDGGSVAGAVSVNAGATLAGMGTVGSVTMTAGAVLIPGDPIGKLTVQDRMTLNGAAKYAFELGSAKKPGESYDQVVVQGALELGGLDFTSFSFTPAEGFGPGVYKLFDASALEGNLGETVQGTVDGHGVTLSADAKKSDVLLTVLAPAGK